MHISTAPQIADYFKQFQRTASGQAAAAPPQPAHNEQMHSPHHVPGYASGSPSEPWPGYHYTSNERDARTEKRSDPATGRPHVKPSVEHSPMDGDGTHQSHPSSIATLKE